MSRRKLILLAALLIGLMPAFAVGLGSSLALDQQLDNAEKKRVLDAIAASVEKSTFDHDMGLKTAEAIRAQENSGEYDAVTKGAAFANRLTKALRDASGDMHFEVIFSDRAIPVVRPEPSSEDRARMAKEWLDQNCMIESAEILQPNIGYLKLNWFTDPDVCEAKLRAAMRQVNDADAVIFDLRNNRGGYPGGVELIAAYLFDHPVYWFNPREAPTEKSWTRSPVAESRLADKPVYVLTSHTTLSGAEQFCYNLKMLKRATLVGETTGGGAHAGVFHRIDDHFGVVIPEVRAVNPYAKHDWEAVGVEPDVTVAPDGALSVAKKLAETKMMNKGVRQ
jgi:hypothetical protein